MQGNAHESSSTSVALNHQARPALAMGHRGLQVHSLPELWEFARAACQTDFVPREFRGSPEKAMVAMEFASELGLPLLAGLRSIAVINGRPSIYGDLMLAMVRASGLLERFAEDMEGTPGTETYRAVCVSKRVGFEPTITSFSVADAKKAKLWSKPGPWTDYPSRMLQMRARSFNLRDTFGDVLMGLVAAEEAMDIPPEVPQGPQALTVDATVSPPQIIPPQEGHPTSEQIKSLRELMQATGIALDRMGIELRTFFSLPEDTKLTLKNLSATLTMADYTRAWQHYTHRLQRHLESEDDVPLGDLPSAKPADVSALPMEMITASACPTPETDADGEVTSMYVRALIARARHFDNEAILQELMQKYPALSPTQYADAWAIAGRQHQAQPEPVPDEEGVDSSWR